MWGATIRAYCTLPLSVKRTHLPTATGLYLVTAGMDQALVLWDVNERKALEKRLLPGCATGVAWHPANNELAVITEDGAWGWWVGARLDVSVTCIAAKDGGEGDCSAFSCGMAVAWPSAALKKALMSAS